MKILRQRETAQAPGARGRRGAALLLSLLILLVLVAIVIQINVSTSTDARVARNDVGLTTMDQAAESALLQVYDQIATDGESAAAAPAPVAEAAPAAAPAAGGVPGAGQEQAQASDSRRDEWAQPLRTEINEIRLRIFVQDEDSKINVLTMLNRDEKEAEAAFERVVRCLDLCREGTIVDIDTRTAEDMAKAMRDHMRQRKLSNLPKPVLLSDDAQNEDVGLPLSLREFAVLQPFEEHHFRDFIDEEGEIVHSIGAFLTVWSSLSTVGDEARGASGGQNVAAGAGAAGGAGNGGTAPGGGERAGDGGGSGTPATGGGAGAGAGGGTAGGAAASGDPTGAPAAAGAAGAGAAGSAAPTGGGYAVNVNTAPPAVLKALFDDREVHPRFWDDVVEYRNLEEEEEQGEDDEEPPLDEYGEEIVVRRIFESLTELAEVDGYHELDAPVQARVNQMLTTQSQVFSIFLIARRTTSVEGDIPTELAGRPVRGEEDMRGDALVRVIRSVVWRHEVDEEMTITPIVRWEVLDYVPYEVLDYAEEDR